jgi:porphyrinogen peroxidase
MATRRPKVLPRKLPKQERAAATVDAILQATTYILVRAGWEAAPPGRGPPVRSLGCRRRHRARSCHDGRLRLAFRWRSEGFSWHRKQARYNRRVNQPQSSILAAIPSSGRFLAFGLLPSVNPRRAFTAIASLSCAEGTVIGLGAPLVGAVGGAIPGLRPFPVVVGPGNVSPSTQGACWVFLGGHDAGELLLRARSIRARLADDFRLDEDVASYVYAGGRDLSGFEDGTENPTGTRATEVAIVSGQGPGLDGSSFVATQRWVHDLGRLEVLSPRDRDLVIGRSHESNEEIADAPPSAHVKRSAQESFDPPAFMVRRSMPWGNLAEHGLVFVAYGASLDPFERVLRRMSGVEDGIVDGLHRFSRPATGGYYWCPPQRDGHLCLQALGI